MGLSILDLVVGGLSKRDRIVSDRWHVGGGAVFVICCLEVGPAGPFG